MTSSTTQRTIHPLPYVVRLAVVAGAACVIAKPVRVLGCATIPSVCVCVADVDSAVTMSVTTASEGAFRLSIAIEDVPTATARPSDTHGGGDKTVHETTSNARAATSCSHECEPLTSMSSPLLDPAINASVTGGANVTNGDGWVGIRTSFGALELHTVLGRWRLLGADNVSLVGGVLPHLQRNTSSADGVSVHIVLDRNVRSHPQSCLENGGQSWVDEPGFTPPFLADNDNQLFAMPLTASDFDPTRANCYPAGFDGNGGDACVPVPSDRCLGLMRRVCPDGPNLWRCVNCLANHQGALAAANCSLRARELFCSRGPHDEWPSCPAQARQRASSQHDESGAPVTSWWSHGRRVDWVLAPLPRPARVFNIMHALSGPAKVPPRCVAGRHSPRSCLVRNSRTIRCGFDKHPMSLSALCVDLLSLCYSAFCLYRFSSFFY